MDLRGVHGMIRWGYRPVAQLSDWHVALNEAERQWTLVARIVSLDAPNLPDSGLMFVAPLKAGSWKWPIESLTVQERTLTARLTGPA